MDGDLMLSTPLGAEDLIDWAVTLEKAAAYIDEYGWTQGHYCNSRGAVCAEGALRAVMSGRPNAAVDTGPLSLFAHLQRRLSVTWQFVEVAAIRRFNDNPDTTAKDVTDFFCNTADVLRREAATLPVGSL